MPEYQTKWVQELPQVGIQCPICGKGFVQMGKYGGVLCFECKTVWKISKFPPKDKTTPPAKIPAEIKMEVMILKELQKFNERLDKMSDYLKKKLGE